MTNNSWIALAIVAIVIAFALFQGANVSFTTIQAITGTDPEATVGDTLIFTSIDGTVAITGSASADTLDFSATGSGSGTGFYNTLQDETVAVTQRQILNFLGTGVTCVDDAVDSTDCTIAAQSLFETINAPAGTDPVADSATDTLNFTVVGSEITITGNSSTDTLEFDFAANAGTDITSDLEEETHASEHAVGGADEVGFYGLIDDEGTPLTARRTLNFIGAGVSCVDDGAGAETDCTIAGGGSGIAVEEGDSLVAAAATTMDFGAGFDVSESPANEANITFDILEVALTNDSVWVGSGGGFAVESAVPNCVDSGGNHLNYTTASGVFSCGTSESETQLLFFTMNAPGGTDPQADTTSDTLNFTVIGSEIVITGNASTDTLEFDLAANAGTDITNDLEEETHAAEHAIGAADEVAFYGLIDDEGTPLTARRTLNFIGAGVTCVDDGAGAETDCTIAGGGSANSFETIDVPTGTDPVADSATDTLFLESQDATVTITGSSATDTINLEVNQANLNTIDLQFVYNNETAPALITLTDALGGIIIDEGTESSDPALTVRYGSPGNQVGLLLDNDDEASDLNSPLLRIANSTSGAGDTHFSLRVDSLGNFQIVGDDNFTDFAIDSAGNFDSTGNGGATIFNADTGFQIGGAAASGNFLRGNGSNFVSSAIQTGDLPTTGTWPFAGTLSGNATITGAWSVTAAGSIDFAGGADLLIAGGQIDYDDLAQAASILTSSNVLTFGANAASNPILTFDTDEGTDALLRFDAVTDNRFEFNKPLDVEGAITESGTAVLQDLFDIYSAPAGTNPVPDTTTDTLTFDSPQGTVSITGNSATDTLSFDVNLTNIDHYDRVQDEGSNLLQRRILNFIGAGVSCVDDGSNSTDCTITDNDAQNLFETIDAPLGSDPVADSPTDTLTLSSPQGTISITGSAAADSLEFDVLAVDISDHTNLAGGRSITLSGDSIEADVELFTIKRSIIIINPTTSETNLVQYEYGTDTTITEVSCSTDTGTASIQFDERARATPNSAGTNVMTSTLVCDTNSQTTTSFTNAGIAADVPLNLQITATASTPGVVRIHVKGTKDD